MYRIRLDGGLLTSALNFEVAVQKAQRLSIETWPHRIITVHNGDVITEHNIVMVMRDGVWLSRHAT